MPKHEGLTDKQAQFVREYLIDLNATQAAIRAGYSKKTARVIGQENLTKPVIAAAVEKVRAEHIAQADLKAIDVLHELKKIGFANMLDYMRVTPEGDPCVDLSTLTREHASALSDFTVEDFTDGRGEEARNVRRVKIKLHDKIGALVQLGKYLGLFAEKSAVPTSPLEEVPTELLLEMRNELLQRRAKLIGTGGG